MIWLGAIQFSIRIKTWQLLSTNNIDVGLYGKGNAKFIENLLEEIVEGESTLAVHDSKLVRTVKVLCLTSDSRQRHCVLAEKLLPNEDVNVSIPRELKEELGVVLPITASYTLKAPIVESKYSASYPGLLSVYYAHHARIEVDQLDISLTDDSPRVTATWNYVSDVQ